MSHDDFAVISDWFNIAILAFAQMNIEKINVKFLSKALSISEKEIENSLENLTRLKLIEFKNGKLIRTSNPISVGGTITSEHIRKYHAQNLDLAKISLLNDSIDERIFGSITIPTNKKKLKLAEKKIQQFKEDMTRLLSTNKPEEVYTVSAQIFPISKTRKHM